MFAALLTKHAEFSDTDDGTYKAYTPVEDGCGCDCCRGCVNNDWCTCGCCGNDQS
jgi:hypothetical protein